MAGAGERNIPGIPPDQSDNPRTAKALLTPGRGRDQATGPTGHIVTVGFPSHDGVVTCGKEHLSRFQTENRILVS